MDNRVRKSFINKSFSSVSLDLSSLISHSKFWQKNAKKVRSLGEKFEVVYIGDV